MTQSSSTMFLSATLDFTRETKGLSSMLVMEGCHWNYMLPSLKSLVDGLAKDPSHVNRLPDGA